MKTYYPRALKAGITLIALFSLMSISVWGQTGIQNKQWVNGSATFGVANGQTPLALPQPGVFNFADLEYVGQTAQYCHNVIQDRNGDILLFVMDHRVYDKNGNIVDLFSVNGAYISQEALIFPNPNTCDEYFVVISAAGNNTPDIHWMLINTGGTAPVVTNTGSHALKTYYRFSTRAARLAVTQAVDDQSGNNTMTRYIYASAGYRFAQFETSGNQIVHLEDYGVNDNASFGGGYYDDDYRTEMEVMSVDMGNTNFILAFPYWSLKNGVSNQPAIALVELGSTGRPLNLTWNGAYNANAHEVLMQHDSDWPKGLELTPDGTHLIFTASESPYVRYIDVQNPAAGWVDINSLPDVQINNPALFREGMLELGRGGAIWLAGDNNTLSPLVSYVAQGNWSNPNGWYFANLTIPNLTLPVTDGNLGSSPRANLILLQDQIDMENYADKDPWNIIAALSGPGVISGAACGQAQTYTGVVNIPGGTPQWLNPVTPNGFNGTFSPPACTKSYGLTFQYTLNGCTYSQYRLISVHCGPFCEEEHEPGFGKQDLHMADGLEIFPNPSTGRITVRGLDQAQVIIVDAMGREVYAGSILDGDTIDLRELASGVYTLQATDTKGAKFSRKLLID